jgi:hypothetical protein
LLETGFSKIAKDVSRPGSSARFQTEHENKATGHLAQRLLLALAIAIGRVAHAAPKQRAEGSETLKADLETHVRHAEPLGTKQLFGLLNSALDQVLVRRGGKGVAKQAQEVIARQTGLLRDLCQVQRQVITFVDITARAAKSLVQIRVARFDLRYGGSVHLR